MDGIHDLGGKQGFGQIKYQPNGIVFHASWEKRVNALYSLAVKSGVFNMDEYRHAIERMPPKHYLNASYYERSLTSLITLCVEKGFASLEELESFAGGSIPLSIPISVGRSNAKDRKKFKTGDIVCVKNDFFTGHTRMPSYIRGKQGVVVGVSPTYPFPDASAHGVKAEYESTYDVKFSSEDLWPNSNDIAFIHVSIFESYLNLAMDTTFSESN